jgi:hypothetical protein
MDELIVLNRGAEPGELTPSVMQLIEAAAAGQRVSAVKYTKSGAAYRREDVVPDSGGEIARLQEEKRRLEIENIGLRSEIEELRQPASEASNGEAGDADAAMLGSLLKAWDRAPEPVREKFMVRVELVRDPLAIPPSLDRRTREARS